MAELRRLELDPIRLKAMAHPLRVEILRVLQRRKRASVTSLAEELGETTGAMSYHLRQLARHGFVAQCDPDEDNPATTPGRRQQWWQMAVDEIHSSGFGLLADAATSEAAGFLLRESVTQNARDLAHWYATATEWPMEWQRAHTAMTGTLELDATQTRALADDLSALLLRYQQMAAGPDARTVAVQYALFPAETGDRP
jgi:DNA-binding transcriptional ArsR family regulator